MPSGHQHALDLAQHLVRVGVALEHVRQRHQVDALRRERQLQRVGGERGARLEGEREAERDAVLSQKVDFGQADLYCPETEHVINRAVKLGQLPAEDVGALGRGKPP